MNYSSTSRPPIASTKRLLLAVYLDYLIYGSAWEIVWYFIGPEKASLVFELLLFFLVESLLLWLYDTPGFRYLSIDSLPVIKSPRDVQFNFFGKHRFVDPTILNGERWYTMTIGVLFILDGAKLLARWTAYGPPLPFFGIETTVLSHAGFAICFGAISIFVGYLVLKLRRSALALGISLVVLQGISTLMSWDMWDTKVVEMVTARREYLGMPIRPGEIEIMQALVPEGFLVILVLMLVALFLIRKRLVHSGIISGPDSF